MLLVSELLAGGGQAPVKSAIALFKAKDVPEDAMEAALGSLGEDAGIPAAASASVAGLGVAEPKGVHPPEGVHIPAQGGAGPVGDIPANPCDHGPADIPGYWAK